MILGIFVSYLIISGFMFLGILLCLLFKYLDKILT